MVKRLLNRIPFKAAMALCIAFFLLLGVVFSSIIINSMDKIWVNIDAGKQVIKDSTMGGITFIYTSSWVSTMNKIEGIIIPFVMCGAGALAGTTLFYRWKMRQPLSQLFEGVKSIQNKNLDFTIAYDAPDELGALCRGFETMRRELDASFKTLWRSQEERKRLNAAFAHDMRTPLTVLKGQADMLEKNLEKGSLDEKKAAQHISFIQESARRFDRYLSNMTSLQRLEDILPEKSYVKAAEYIKKMGQAFAVLAEDGKNVTIKAPNTSALLYMDEAIVTQVLENVVANALRYAAGNVEISIVTAGNILAVDVEDDGKGFGSEALKYGLEPFFRCEDKESSTHMGLGLYICKILTEKHGGGIKLSNSEGKGAHVRAEFSMKT